MMIVVPRASLALRLWTRLLRRARRQPRLRLPLQRLRPQAAPKPPNSTRRIKSGEGYPVFYTVVDGNVVH